MEKENFSHLPNIDKRKSEERLSVYERAIAIIPGKDEEREIYVAGRTKDGLVVLSISLNPNNPRLIHDIRVAIEPQYIIKYKTVESYR